MVVDSEKQIQAAVCTLYQQVSDLKLSFLIQFCPNQKMVCSTELGSKRHARICSVCPKTINFLWGQN